MNVGLGVVLDQNQYSGQNVDFVMTVGPWTTKNDAGVLEMHLQCSLTRFGPYNIVWDDIWAWRGTPFRCLGF